MSGSAIPSDVDLTEVFRSPHLKGLGGFKPIAQSQDHTCGAACVAAIIRHLGGTANEGQAAQAMGTNRVVGTTTQQIIQYLKGRNFKARGYYNVPLQVIVDRVTQGKITMVGWNDYDGHWCVVAGVEPHMRVIVLADPARARSHFACHTYEQFEKHWQCHVLGRGKRFEHLAVLVDNFNPACKKYKGVGIKSREKVHKIWVWDWVQQRERGRENQAT